MSEDDSNELRFYFNEIVSGYGDVYRIVRTSGCSYFSLDCAKKVDVRRGIKLETGESFGQKLTWCIPFSLDGLIH